jgi:hypothetical protein
MKRRDSNQERLRRAEIALEASRIPGSSRDDYDEHAAVHHAARMIPEWLIDEAIPSREKIREKLAAEDIALLVAASEKRPRWESNLLRDLENNEVIPEQLLRLPGNRLVRRSHLTPDEQKWLAESKELGSRKAQAEACYERALSDPFTEWGISELAKGRLQSELIQLTFWKECGHLGPAR